MDLSRGELSIDPNLKCTLFQKAVQLEIKLSWRETKQETKEEDKSTSLEFPLSPLPSLQEAISELKNWSTSFDSQDKMKDTCILGGKKI